MAKESKLTTTIAILGWIVAAASLILNFLMYHQSNIKFKQEMENHQEKPIYEKLIKTYNPDILPKNILNLTEEIPHEFEVNHHSGKAIDELVIQFFSHEKDITDVKIYEGKTDTKIKIDPAKKEITLRKPELLPSTSLKGIVLTKGITKLKMVVSADEGSDFAEPVSSNENRIERFDWRVAIFFTVLALIIILFGFLIHRSLPKLKDSGVLNIFKSEEDNLSLLFLIILIMIFRSSYVGAAIQGLILYFVITRYKLILNALKNLAEPRHQSKPSDSQPSTLNK